MIELILFLLIIFVFLTGIYLKLKKNNDTLIITSNILFIIYGFVMFLISN